MESERRAHRLFDLMEQGLLSESAIRGIVRDVEATLRNLTHEECRAKFVAGSIEHGDDWLGESPEFVREHMRSEVIDLVNYYAMETMILEAL